MKEYIVEWTAKRILSVAIFGAIILVFALFGLPTGDLGGGGGAGFVAVVNDAIIPVADFQQEVQQMEQMYGQFFGGNMGAQQGFIRSQAVEKLINREIIAQETDRNGIHSPDNEIRDFLVEQTYFQDNGRFNRDKYDMFLQRTGRTAASFENQLRKDLRSERVNQLFGVALKPTKGIVNKEKELKLFRLNLQYVRLQSSELESKLSVASTESDLTKFAEEHKKEISDYYESNKQEFNKEEEVRARHILIKAQKGDKKSEDAAFKKISEIAEMAKKSDFGDLAQKYSEDSTKTKKGDLGFFARGRMVPEFEKVAFMSEIGKVSAPVKTDFGYHLIQVMEKSLKSSMPLEKAKSTIAQKLMRKIEFNKVMGELKQLVAKKDVTGIEKVLTRFGLKWEETGFFSLGEYSIPKLGSYDDFAEVVSTVSASTPLADKLVSSQGVEYLIKYKSSETKDEKLDIDTLSKELSRSRGMGAMSEWIKDARTTALIKTNKRFMTEATN